MAFQIATLTFPCMVVPGHHVHRSSRAHRAVWQGAEVEAPPARCGAVPPTHQPVLFVLPTQGAVRHVACMGEPWPAPRARSRTRTCRYLRCEWIHLPGTDTRSAPQLGSWSLPESASWTPQTPDVAEEMQSATEGSACPRGTKDTRPHAGVPALTCILW